MERNLIVLLGPTGVGKTETALQLAEHYGCPIINADSRQIYRDIPIGTAAPTPEEQRRAKHYFVGTHALTDYYSAAQFEQEAIDLMLREFQQHPTLIMSGGSMMYLDAVCHGIDLLPTISPDVRQALQKRWESEGADALLAELRMVDPAYYAQCDLRNTKRIVHALEVYYESGQPYSSFLTRQSNISPDGTPAQNPRLRDVCIHKIGLNRPRPELFDRINRRVEQMLADGLLEEARRVLPHRAENSLNTVGYKEMFQVLDGEWSLPFATARMQKNTRVYAKKQLTWFQRDKSIRWFEAGTPILPHLV